MTSNTTLRTAIAVAALGACSHMAWAEGIETKFSGFGTLGYVTTNTDDAMFRANPRQHKGATDSSGDWGVDSRLGLQGDVKFNDTFSAVGQLYAARRDGEFAPTVEWLFGQAKVNDWASVRLGRMVLPVFLVSDSRTVGYASHWLRAPIETYGSYIPSAFDGVQGVFRGTAAGFNLTTQVSYGTTKADLFAAAGGHIVQGSTKGNKLMSLNLVAEQGDWTLRIGSTLNKDATTAVATNAVHGDDSFTGIGAQYDNGKLMVMSEYIMRRWSATGPQDGIYDSNAYHLTGGYRFGEWMPYATYAAIEPKGVGYGDPLLRKRSTTAIGVRWDAMKNVAIKAQVENMKGPANFQYLVTNPSFNNVNGTRAVSVGVDFVF